MNQTQTVAMGKVICFRCRRLFENKCNYCEKAAMVADLQKMLVKPEEEGFKMPVYVVAVCTLVGALLGAIFAAF